MNPLTDAEPPRLCVAGICKSFAVPVLRNVGLELNAGEVHALLGANGAGKSTFSRILAGLLVPDQGSIRVDGHPVAFTRKRDAERAGIFIVQQELNLIGNLSVAENLALTRLPTRFGWIQKHRLHTDARQRLQRVGCGSLDPDRLVRTLGIGQQQLLEIAAALDEGLKLLILDEPTAALTGPEVQQLFGIIREITADGVSVLYISHRMDEIEQIADRLTVLRDGRAVLQGDVSGTKLPQIVEAMSGELADESPPVRGSARTGRPVLQVRELNNGLSVRNISFDVHAGEVLGVAGLIGAGRTELLRCLFGRDQARSGTLSVVGRRSKRPFASPVEARQFGLRFVPEDRRQQGLLQPLSIRDNMSLARWPSVRGPVLWIRAGKADELAAGLAARLRIQYQDLEQPVRELSGGNQQKVVISRCLDSSARLLLLDEPTRGIDISARNSLYRTFRTLADDGLGIVWVSSDLEELMQQCDRILVMHRGQLVAKLARGEWSAAMLNHLALDGAASTDRVPDQSPLDQKA